MKYRMKQALRTVLMSLVIMTIVVVAGCNQTPAQGGVATIPPPSPQPTQPTEPAPTGEESTSGDDMNGEATGETGEPALPEPVQVAQSDKQREEAPQVSDETLNALVEGNTAFAFALYQALREEEGNLFYSPYSISAALAMTYAGAREETASQIQSALHFLPPEQTHPAFNALDLNLTSRGEEEQRDMVFELSIANSLWGQHDRPFQQEFLDTLAQHYGAGLRLVNFKENPEASRNAINQWVSDETNQKIENLIPSGGIDTLTRLVLANAIYFKANWDSPFREEATSEEDFHLLDGSTATVNMMKQTEEFRYAAGEGYQVVVLPYGYGMEMIVIVPDAGTFAKFEPTLSGARFQEITSDFSMREVNLHMPKFTFETGVSLKTALSSLGLEQAFTQDANFSGMDGTRELSIGNVFHKAFIAVDEEGTEAAAATALTMSLTAAEPVQEIIQLTIDRPFIFAIHDHETDSVLFVGRVLNPNA
jgi:serpin B